MVYKPVRIGDHDYIDGSLRGSASLDLAIEKGATLVVCINPLVPYDNRSRESIPYLGKDGGHLSGKGIQSIANQSLRILSHSGLHYHVKQLRRAHPEVDIILIEPQAEDYQMSFYNIMRYSARLIVAQHGFESVTLDLASDYQYFKQVLTRHGIPISRSTVIEELSQIASSNNDPTVIQRVLEARTNICSARKRDTPMCKLNRVLAELEFALEDIEEEQEEASFQRLWQV